MNKARKTSPAKARIPSTGGGGAAGAVIAVDWGVPFASKRPKPHVAAVKSSDVRVIRFKHVQELIEKVPAPAVVFAEASGPYLELCEAYDAYGEGNVFCVDTALTAEYRGKLGLRKSDESDARVILKIAEDWLAGRLSEGVWRFVPDELKRGLSEEPRLFKCYQKLLGLDPEMAREYERRRREKIKEIEALAKKDEACRELRRYLMGFGETGTSVAQAIAELRGKRFGSVKRLYRYARENRRLQKAISSLAQTIWLNRNKSGMARRLIEQLASNPRYGGVTKSQLKRWILVSWSATQALKREGGLGAVGKIRL